MMKETQSTVMQRKALRRLKIVTDKLKATPKARQ